MEVLIDYADIVQDREGRAFRARACGHARADGLWEAWLEFTGPDGGIIRTDRETTQPNRADLMYWAGGLTHAYLDGALLRATTASFQVAPAAPAPAARVAPAATPAGMASPTAVLDPFAVYREGADVLRSQLRALDEGQLRNIVRAYSMAPPAGPDLDIMNRVELAELVLRTVQNSAG